MPPARLYLQIQSYLQFFKLGAKVFWKSCLLPRHKTAKKKIKLEMKKLTTIGVLQVVKKIYLKHTLASDRGMPARIITSSGGRARYLLLLLYDEP